MITFFDTNIFVYAIDESESIKRRKATARLEQARAQGTVALSAQVLHEFYNVTRSKLKPPLSHDQAAQAISYLCEFSVLGSSASSVQAALVLKEQHQTSWWDALILEAALRADADVLVSEDFSHGQRFGKLVVENPFL
ncbi:MAG: PIN domain-containing protein [Brachymonas sp.]|nr:PIN domain-containing protein [Brachymonas sp.]